MKRISVGLLDFGYRSAHLNSMLKLSDVIEYAVRGEELGYDKFWLGEHHMPKTTLPWNDPSLLIPVLAAHTNSIHIGTAGTLICIHQPYQIASAFKFYGNIYRNRIDLGFANGQPYEGVARHAGGASSAQLISEFDKKVNQTVAFLQQEELLFQQEGIVIPPYKGVQPRLWTLGSSSRSIQRALELKTNLCFWANNQFTPELQSLLQEYRECFEARYQQTPHIRVVILGICQRSEQKAKAIARTQNEKDNLLCGTVVHFSDYVQQYGEYYGIDEFIFFDAALNPTDRITGQEEFSKLFTSPPVSKPTTYTYTV